MYMSFYVYQFSLELDKVHTHFIYIYTINMYNFICQWKL